MSSPLCLNLSLMRTAKAAILSAMALLVPGEALASALLLDHSISPAPDAIHSPLALGLNAARSVSCVDAARFHFASHPGTSLETAHAAATPNPGPETLNAAATPKRGRDTYRSEEHTSELQSLRHLVCRLLLEKKKEHVDLRTHDPSQTTSA